MPASSGGSKPCCPYCASGQRHWILSGICLNSNSKASSVQPSLPDARQMQLHGEQTISQAQPRDDNHRPWAQAFQL